jgi:hypothetical protein
MPDSGPAGATPGSTRISTGGVRIAPARLEFVSWARPGTKRLLNFFSANPLVPAQGHP